MNLRLLALLAIRTILVEAARQIHELAEASKPHTD